MSTSGTERVNEMFYDLAHCNEDKQKQIIEEMNKQFDDVILKNNYFPFTKELFNKIDKMIEDKKLSMENTVILLKCIGYCNALKNMDVDFYFSELRERVEKMIIEKDKEKEEKDEKFLIEICECYLFLNDISHSKLLSICVPRLLKAASKKEENEEAQKGVEMALLALSSIHFFEYVKKELFLDEISEIIQSNQEHRNLTHLAYQSAWRFFLYRFIHDQELKDVVVDELFFVEEATKELKELTRSVNWKAGEGEGKETKEEQIIIIWLNTLINCYDICELCCEGNAELVACVVTLCRASNVHCSEICHRAINLLGAMISRKSACVSDIVGKGAFDVVLEKIQQPTLDYNITRRCLEFLWNFSDRLRDEAGHKADEANFEMLKRKILEKLEEEGYEDITRSFREVSPFFDEGYGTFLNDSDVNFFVNI
ncbi:uncharacterized protein MONOS_6273 [Monocercomonoides exilis]|uniref:uncharacterized protein n=1 Tax=Monocercomonoides exilis TaxID=2049356 RepID=UPI003559A0C8|nr:hypothetical protein MONOS_6273 [Monocercomonoides exilis]|eukprot:MONOS_6273.1-p1 / transcript=MONOS_6273.1 / gene=MONOS_6273 / organism=Monocercomonoides_exilis_PA203 / gene_product=unspecified product / transcript_product=unspecified product / location=Mono_scaffold00195:48024-49555(+) / protein_length=427 / sequence_SO=supercontig / SO=protein_coding / is_pseudo=false